MDTPGYDPVSVTGLVAGGANVVVFTTGRGSVLGCKPAAVDQGRDEHRDVRAHARGHGHRRRRHRRRHRDPDQVGEQIFEAILAVASGRATVSEDLDLGHDEFVPWQLGAVT